LYPEVPRYCICKMAGHGRPVLASLRTSELSDLMDGIHSTPVHHPTPAHPDPTRMPEAAAAAAAADPVEGVPTPAKLQRLKSEGFETCRSDMAADADEEAEDTLAPQGQQMQVSPPQSPVVPTPPQSPMVPTPSQSALVQTPSQSSTVPTLSHQGCCRQHRPTATHVSQYDAFLSHDWGTDTHGRPNHDRVKTICEGLEERGLRVWFDANNMSDDVQRDMVEGIQNSKCLVAFVTQNYIEKVGSKGFDNCKGEFDYARTIEKPMIAVPMETCMQNTKNWLGPVGMWLGTKLYPTSFADGIECEQLDALAQKIQKLSALPSP